MDGGCERREGVGGKGGEGGRKIMPDELNSREEDDELELLAVSTGEIANPLCQALIPKSKSKSSDEDARVLANGLLPTCTCICICLECR